MNAELDGRVAARVISAESAGNAGTLADIFAYLAWVYQRCNLIRVVCCSELKQTIVRSKISYLWWIMDPIFDTLCYVFLVFALGRGIGGSVPYPIFILTAIIPWRWSSGCWNGSTKLWQQYSSLISQLRFPYMSLLLARFTHELVLYLISYIVLFGTCMIYGYYPQASWLLLPVVMLIHGITILALMFFFSTISTYFSDFERILPFLLRLWFFCSPALYGLENLPEWAQKLMMFNPMTLILINYRGCLLYGELSHWTHFATYGVISLLFLFLGVSIFIRKEPYITRYV